MYDEDDWLAYAREPMYPQKPLNAENPSPSQENGLNLSFSCFRITEYRFA